LRIVDTDESAVMSASRRTLAIDYGRRRIGLAICDELGIASEPLGFVARDSDDAAARIVAAVAAEHAAVALVIGLALHANGDEGSNVRLMRRFCHCLRRHCSLPINEVDERHSSSEAEGLLRRAGKWPVSPGELDAKAAQVILMRYLNGER
jgi:putative Holliday junction resolvase